MRASWPGNSGGWGVGGRRELRNEPHHAALSGFGSGDCGVAAGEAGLGAGAGLGRQGRKPAPDFDGTNPFRLQILELIRVPDRLRLKDRAPQAEALGRGPVGLPR